MVPQALRGTTDLLSDEITRWLALEQAVRRLCVVYGYQELRTPLIEDASLFLRSIGQTTDIVQKEMFRVHDRGDQEMVLRPEGTVPMVRAYLEHNLHKTDGFVKLFYMGPMFRAERPQAGRFRQFHQYGVEAIGSASPWVDVEVITLCLHILRECGLSQSTLWLSTMGCREDQQRSAERLRVQLQPDRMHLCKDCQSRFEKNVFRVLDCKQKTCQKIAQEAVRQINQDAGKAPPTPFSLCDECAKHFDEVRSALRDSGIAFDDTQVFARGLDYYTRTVFEVRHAGLGSQDAVAAGGRYDRLVEEMGGPPMGAVGFATGIERVLLAAACEQTQGEVNPTRRGVYVAVTEAGFIREGFRLIQQLHNRGAQAIMSYDGKSLRAQLREADQAGCQFVAILGERELKGRTISLRELAARCGSRELGKSERTVPLEAFVDEVSQHVKPPCH